MNFRFFDDLMGSARTASLEFRFRERKHSAKNYSAKLLKKFSKVYIKFLKFVKNFKSC